MKKSFIALAAIGAALAGAPVSAQNIKIEYRDLNLATAEGQAALENRVTKAARKVCGYNDLRTGTRGATRDMRRCLVQAKKSAKAQVASLVDDNRLGG